MLLLPSFNATLRPCSANPAEFTAHAKGHFCGSCQRVVQDFSRSTNPLADLAAARAAAPDGRVCGMFRAKQVRAPRMLTQRLKWFVLALVLVVGQGLTAHEALAQMRKPTQTQHVKGKTKRTPHTRPARAPVEAMRCDAANSSNSKAMILGAVQEETPSFRGGGTREMIAYIQQQLRWPPKTGALDAEGRAYVSFTVGTDGRVHDAKIVKGLHPLLDAETLRVVRSMKGFKPGTQNGRPVPVLMTVPVTFQR